MHTEQSLALRTATAQDADLLAELGEQTFREAFAAQNDPADLAAYLSNAFGPLQQATELAELGSTFLLAESGTEAVGYARLRVRETPACIGGDPLELARIYVLPGWQGRKVGSILMSACIAEAKYRDCRTLWLGVWERNPRAVAFYQRWGFQVVGQHYFQLGRDLQTDLLMERSL